MKKFLLAIGVVVMVTVMAVGAFAQEPIVNDVFAKRGMVSSAHELASKAGVEVLQKGGNAIDAAIATALALNVVEPNASGMGGGGFMVIRFAKTGEVVELDYRETAPASSTKDMFASEKAKQEKWSQLGGKASGVPGYVLGMWNALERYGTMTWAEVAEPAIRLAEEGFTVVEMQTGIIADNLEKLHAYNDPAQVPFFKDGLPVEAGTVLKQPNLARAFRLIGEQGPKAFYEGPIGEAFVRAINANGGEMTMADLKNYKMETREPVSGTYRGYHIYSTPPASSGGTHIVQLLNIMENFPVADWGHNNPKYLHYLGEAMKLVFADRAAYMADSAFVDVPLKGLTSKEYAKNLAAKIRPHRVMLDVEADDPWPFQQGAAITLVAGTDDSHISTSHFSVADAEGNIVASTNTVNYFFGSGVIVPEWGIVANNQMDDFSSDPASVNAPEPGKRPLSSMSPSIVLDPDGKPFMTIGAAGAWRIITSVSQIIMNVVDFGMTMDEAIEQPRIFTYASGGKAGPFRIEDAMDPVTVEFLKIRGHNVEVQPRGGYFGTAQGILFTGEGLNGGADSRRLGVPVGY
jgi:gamma-glutamyltranspeptidase/glutathione hydrolase